MNLVQLLCFIYCLIFNITVYAEISFIDAPNFEVHGCRLYADAEFINPMIDQKCARQTYCMSTNVNCFFFDKEILKSFNGNWNAMKQAGPEGWIQADGTIFCKQENASCNNLDIDVCANKSPEEIQCSMQDLPGIPKIFTIPRKRTGTSR